MHTAVSRRDRAAALAGRLRITDLIEHLPKPTGLLAINYHRIATSLPTAYDDDVFSATAEAFQEHVRYLKRRFDIVSLKDALDIASGRARIRGVAALITFDDGYIDCYKLAFPVLRCEHASATFFLVSSMIGSDAVPWWDQIANAIKKTRKTVLRLEYPDRMTLTLDENDRTSQIRAMLGVYKARTTIDPQRFLDSLLRECDVVPSADGRLFLDWSEISEMHRCGMDFGSHTHTHRLLGRLPLDEQVDELWRSREILEAGLKAPVDVLAYPVGVAGTFNDDSVRALSAANYKAAFSFYGGINQPGRANPFDLKRVSAEAVVTFPRYRLQCALAPHLSGYWF